jgi:hypothetical protein
MDDPNGADVVAKFCGQNHNHINLETYKKAWRRLKLYRHPDLPILHAEHGADGWQFKAAKGYEFLESAPIHN